MPIVPGAEGKVPLCRIHVPSEQVNSGVAPVLTPFVLYSCPCHGING